MIKKLLAKKRLHILGMNSGTSADGIDLAVIRFEMKGSTPGISFIDGAVKPYPKNVRFEIERLIKSTHHTPEDIARYNLAYGHYLGKIAAGYIAASKHKIDMVASHGQTISHVPQKVKTFGDTTGVTIQIGDGNALAQTTGVPTVFDFRTADIAAGGEGAPLTPFVNHLLFGDRKSARIVVNIGGIANYSYHPAGGKIEDIRGGDCGPGNILSDMVCHLLCKKSFDADGALARSGEILPEIVKVIQAANKNRKRSAGREQFDYRVLAKIMHAAGGMHANRHDVLASTMEATVRLIYAAIKKHLNDSALEAVYLTGGGRKNRFLRDRLKGKLGKTPLKAVESLGYDGDYLEAVSFAVLGGCFLHGMPSTLPHVTGAKGNHVAGRLALP